MDTPITPLDNHRKFLFKFTVAIPRISPEFPSGSLIVMAPYCTKFRDAEQCGRGNKPDKRHKERSTQKTDSKLMPKQRTSCTIQSLPHKISSQGFSIELHTIKTSLSPNFELRQTLVHWRIRSSRELYGREAVCGEVLRHLLASSSIRYLLRSASDRRMDGCGL